MQSRVLDGAALSRGDKPLSQKELPAMVDTAALRGLLEAEHGDVGFAAHVSLSRQSGSSAWLTAPLALDGREFSTLRSSRPLSRVLFCACGRDRTVRHNSLRNVVCDIAVEAGLQPEREKAGLLPSRPDGDGLPMETGLRP